jgi:K+-transporting ATPase ATPase C chain
MLDKTGTITFGNRQAFQFLPVAGVDEAESCLSLTAILLTLCCVLYPALVTAAAQTIFPSKANGEAVTLEGTVRGARLIGQTFADNAQWPEYFWGRPSAASVDAATSVLYSSGSNYGPTNPALRDEVEARVKALRDTGVTGPIPVDLVTKSGSGLDPHLSPVAVAIQIPRVAKARGLSEAEVHALVDAQTERSMLGFLGEPRVNVLLLNLALDARKKVPHTRPLAEAPSTPR